MYSVMLLTSYVEVKENTNVVGGSMVWMSENTSGSNREDYW
jgi:hypothetical protein